MGNEHLDKCFGQHNLFIRQMMNANKHLLRHCIIADNIHGTTALAISQNYY